VDQIQALHEANNLLEEEGEEVDDVYNKLFSIPLIKN
jgi:hypothetical protein